MGGDRREARTAYLQIAKQRKPNRKKIRKAMRQQLGYVRRNLGHIDTLFGNESRGAAQAACFFIFFLVYVGQTTTFSDL